MFRSFLQTLIAAAVLLAGSLATAQEVPLRDVIDAQIAAGWQARSVTPAAPASDADFLRRVTLDLTGTIPMPAVVRAFLDDPDPAKREKLVDRLLASSDYARHMQHVFDVMFNERQYANYVPEPDWQEYLRSSFADDKPWDQLTRELLGADGVDPKLRPALRYLLVRTVDSYRILNPHAMTRDIGRHFLGINLQCAQCHNHPSIGDYKQADYFGIYAFFSRLGVYADKVEGKDAMVLMEKADGDVSFFSVFDKSQTRKGMKPHLPGAAEIGEPTPEKGQEYKVPPDKGRAVPAFSRRDQVTKLLPVVVNRQFTRNIANRLWAQLFGRGIVDPVDLHHGENPPSHPELLDLLGTRFAAGGFRFKPFLKELVLSKTYALSSTPADSASPPPPAAFAVSSLRPLRDKQLAFAWMEASGFSEFTRQSLGAALTEAKLYQDLVAQSPPLTPLFGNSMALPDDRLYSSLEQALFLANNDWLVNKIKLRPGSLIDRAMKLTDPALVADELYISVFARRPTPDETAEVAAYLTGRDADRQAALEELTWSLLTSIEFRFQR